MVDRSFLTRAAWTIVIVLAGYLLVERLRSSPSSPEPAPPADTTLAPERPPEPPAAAPPANEMPASALSPTAPGSPSASPGPQVSPSASASPTADPAAAQRAEQEKVVRAQVAAAKARADSLSAAAGAECPDLKPGELRHPGAVAHCTRLRSDAAQAVSEYESLKQQALAAGVTVQ